MDSEKKEISLSFFLEYIFGKLLYVLITAIALMSISLGVLFYVTNFKSNQSIAYVSLIIEDEKFNEIISNNYIINDTNIEEAIKLTNLDDLLASSIGKNTFQIISGQKEITELVDFLSEQNYTQLAKTLAVDPKIVSEKVAEVADSNSRYKTITIDLNKTELNKTQVESLISNLLLIANQKAQRDFDLSNIQLKNLKTPNIDNINSYTISEINNYIDLAENYLNILNTDFSSFATDINLDITQNKMSIVRDLFRDVLRLNENLSIVLAEKLQLELKAIKQKIFFAQEILLSLDVSPGISQDSPNSAVENSYQNINLDMDAIDKIASMGGALNNSNLIEEYTSTLFDFQMEEVELEKKINNLLIKSDATSSSLELRSQLNAYMMDINSDINNYIDQIKLSKKVDEPIKLIGKVRFIEATFIDQVKFPIVILILASLGVSFGFVILKGLKEDFR